MRSRPRILLADDHPGVLKALGRILALQCDVVGVVSDGSAVADAAAGLQPVVVLTDLHLPGASGLDACRQISRRNLRARVIVMSGMVDEGLKGEALAAGASDFVSKCAPADDLFAAVRSAWTEIDQ